MPMNIEELRARIAVSSIPEICRATGLSYNTVKAIRDGKPSCRTKTIELLVEHFTIKPV